MEVHYLRPGRSAGQARPAHRRSTRRILRRAGSVINPRRTSGADHLGGAPVGSHGAVPYRKSTPYGPSGTPEHLVYWAKLCPRTIQSGAKNTAGPAGQGNPWLKGALGEAANAAARTDTFLGARYRRIVKRRGHAKALVAVARSILVITWHLINEPDASYQELGSDWHQRHLNPARKTRNLVRQLQALGHQVTLEPAAS
ncbi:transposase [Streptomyces sp. NPDC002671]